MRAIHPGEVLKEEIIEAKGLTITETARLLGVTRTNLSNIANQKSDISPEMAYRVALVFGGTAEVWSNLQTKYNLHEAAQRLKLLNLNHTALVTVRLFVLNHHSASEFCF